MTLRKKLNERKIVRDSIDMYNEEKHYSLYDYLNIEEV